MSLRRWIHHFKVAVVSTVVVAVAALICGVLWLNEKGFAGEWGARIASELSARGIHADFQEARFSPLHGIIVKNAIVYFDEKQEDRLAHVESLIIDIDRAKALRGELLLRKLELRNATLSIPVATGMGDQSIAEISELNGEVTIDRQGRFLLQKAHGVLAGMEFHLHAELDHFELAHLSGQARETADQSRSEFLQILFAELAHWSFSPSTPPRLDLRLAGNLKKPSTIRAAFTLEADELDRSDYDLKNVVLAGTFLGRHLSIKRFHFSDGAGELTTHADYDLRAREGRYTVSSSIHLSRMLRTCFNQHVLDELYSTQAPRIEGSGSFRLAPDGSFSVDTSGSLEIPPFRFLGSSFESLKTDFSWNEESIFFRDLEVTHESGSLTGKVLIQGDNITYRANSTLPVSVLAPFIKDGSGLGKIISNCQFSPDSLVEIRAERGNIKRSNLKDWDSQGHAKLTNVSYRGVPLRTVTADYNINQIEHIYSNIEGVFDYTHYAPRRRHGTASTGLVRADRISHDRSTKITDIRNLRGTAWPGPLLRLFAPKAADHVEDRYRFRTPPTFVTSKGIVGHRDEVDETDVRISLKTHGTTDYTFLNRVINARQLSAQIRYQHREVDVTGLKFRVFEGPIGGSVNVRINPGAPSRYSGGIQWTRLRLSQIGNTYGFAKADQGYVTGRFDFRGTSGNIRTLGGTGAIGLERGHLFFVPVLGPLSTILGGILGDKRASHEEARDASCTFAVRDGIFYTKDFLTSTPSTVFTGDGSIDLHQKTIDMTVRMNARGLLGLITLPLRPFNGLFQFSGRGPLNNPTWRSASFEPPARGKNDPIYRKPSRAVVIPERRNR